MDFLLQVYIVCLFAIVVDSAHRVPRAMANSCPRDIDFPKGMNCKNCVKYRRRGSKATLRCPKGFSRYGNKRLVCGKDDLWKGDFPLCVKSGCSPIDTSNDLNLVMSLHPKFDDAMITFQCEADSIMFGPPEIHCDGVKWSSLPPRCADITDLLSCDFEEDLCGWTQDSAVIGNQNWTRGIGPTMTGGTGPRRDHTHPNSDTGHYMYLETSAPTKEGDKAVLVSPMYTADFSPMCFEFWYHMLGPDDHGHVGSLDVYIKAESDQFKFLQPEFHKEGNQGDTWNKGDIFIDDQIESYQLLIVATKMKSYISDISIDDVRLYNCTQTTSTTEGTTTTTLVSTSTPLTSTTPTTTPTSVSSELSTRQNMSLTTQPTGISTTINNTFPTSGIVISTESPVNTTEAVTNSTIISTNIQTFESTLQNRSVTMMKSSLSTPKPSTLVTNTTVASSSNTAQSSTVLSTKITNATTVQSTTTSAPASSSTTKPSTGSSTTISTTIKPDVITTKKKTRSTAVLTSSTASTPQTTVSPTFSTSTTTTITSPTTPPTVVTTHTVLLSSSTVSSSPASTRQTHRSTDSRPITSRDTTPTVLQTTSSSSETSSIVPSISTTEQNSQQNSTQVATNVSTKSLQSSTPITTAIVKTTVKTIHNTNNGQDSNATAKAAISKHPEDDTLKPLMIGLGVGIIVGLIIIGIVVWACMRRRKFYTRGYEDELKPITNAASTQSLNNVEYYQDDFDIEHIQ